MLLGDFFEIETQETAETTIDSQIALNVNHPIYKGHFPQQPVVPGVCMMQLLAELTSNALGRKVQLKKANQAKFLVPIVPENAPNLTVNIKYVEQEMGSLKITGAIKDDTTTFFKFKGLFA